LHGGADLVEKVQALVDLTLGIGWVGALLWRDGAASDASIAGVDAADCIAIASATGVASTGDSVAYLTGLASASLATLPGLTLLLSALAGLSVARQGAGLELLAARLTLFAWRVAESGKLVAQTREIVHGAV